MSAPIAPRPAPSSTRGLPAAAAFGFLVAIVGVIILVASGFGYRFGVWSLHAAVGVLGVGGWVSLVGGLLSLFAAVLTRPGTGRRGFMLSVLGVILGLGSFGEMVNWQLSTRSAPAIHDITTDFANPPTFTAALQTQSGMSSPGQYAGAAVAAQQRAAYPEIGPAELPGLPPGAAFRIALAAARNSGWNIVIADSAGGRIEATATTPWFGFTDDIVVRIGPSDNGSRVDVRSFSSAGQDDADSNARRVRQYVAQLERTV
jgi:uncharacterized protein (DUF1499 family)